ncbi:MAG: acetyl-CoA carboxylase biotin carboxyl carrier protein subunit [Anaerolineales bacterium]
MKLTFEDITLDLTPSDKGYTAALGDRSIFIEVAHAEDGNLDLIADGQRMTAYVSPDGAKRWVTVNRQTFVLTKSSGMKQSNARQDRTGALTAPMPGQVQVVNVKAGEAVTKGQTLLVLEAMKMEIRIQAPRDGRVKALHVEQGQTVEREQALIELEEK